MSTDLEERILQIIEEIAMTTVSMDDELLKDNIIESITAVDLALRIEEEFNCPIPPHEIVEHVATPRVLVGYILKNRPG